MKNNISKGKHIIILLIFFIFPLLPVKAEIIFQKTLLPEDTIVAILHQTTITKTNKLTAIAFAILTGPLGGHRVYLGTTTRIPLIYTATLGGFGILVVADIIAILTTKDLSVYCNNNNIFMWVSSKQN